MRTCIYSYLPSTLSRTVLFLLPLVLWASSGCGWRKDRAPAAGSARQALETALNAWQNGQKAGKIEAASPPVQAVDSGWGKGQRLADYEILEEVKREDGKRCFKVRLQLQQPPASQEVNYLVVGQSPLWIYREEDYKRASGWEGTK